jgi:hypothetical protein
MTGSIGTVLVVAGQPRDHHEPAALSEPGFVVVSLHADVPDRPDQGQEGEDDAKRTR